MSFPLGFLLIVSVHLTSVRKRNIALQLTATTSSIRGKNQLLTETLLFVSAISVLFWLPMVFVNYITAVRQVDIPDLFVAIIFFPIPF